MAVSGVRMGVGVWNMWPRFTPSKHVPLLCWCGVLGGVVVGVGVGVWVNGSPMAVASRLMWVNGVGCWCGHCPMLGGVVVMLGGVAMWDEHRQSPRVWVAPSWQSNGGGEGAGEAIGWCKHSISEKKKKKKKKKNQF